MSMMVIRDDRKRTLHSCPVIRHLGVFRNPEDTIENDNEPISEYYSEDQAKDAGWVKTKDLMFCDPDLPYVWVCPNCAKKIDWMKEGVKK